MGLEDFALLAAAATGFAVSGVATGRLFRWFTGRLESRLPGAVTLRWRAPTLFRPS